MWHSLGDDPKGPNNVADQRAGVELYDVYEHREVMSARVSPVRLHEGEVEGIDPEHTTTLARIRALMDGRCDGFSPSECGADGPDYDSIARKYGGLAVPSDAREER